MCVLYLDRINLAICFHFDAHVTVLFYALQMSFYDYEIVLLSACLKPTVENFLGSLKHSCCKCSVLCLIASVASEIRGLR